MCFSCLACIGRLGIVSPQRWAPKCSDYNRNKEISSVKVVWRGPAGEYATWELESKMRESYPELFSG
ncbi:hypothetical protein A2U01_0062352, partial [Trifolium medium]|nr:hypothetical protein [Trifolium medium]